MSKVPGSRGVRLGRGVRIPAAIVDQAVTVNVPDLGDFYLRKPYPSPAERSIAIPAQSLGLEGLAERGDQLWQSGVLGLVD